MRYNGGVMRCSLLCLCLFVSVNVNKLWIIWIKLSAGVDWIWKGGRSPGTWFEHIWGAVCFTRSTTPSIPITDPNFACSPILVHTPFSGAGTIFSLGEWAWRDGNRKNSNNCSCRNLLSPVADTATQEARAWTRRSKLKLLFSALNSGLFCILYFCRGTQHRSFGPFAYFDILAEDSHTANYYYLDQIKTY